MIFNEEKKDFTWENNLSTLQDKPNLVPEYHSRTSNLTA